MNIYVNSDSFDLIFSLNKFSLDSLQKWVFRAPFEMTAFIQRNEER
jgi:hypothetical protein